MRKVTVGQVNIHLVRFGAAPVKQRAGPERIFRVMDAITLTWYLRLAVAFVMLLAGWKLTGLVYVSTVAIGLAIKDELKALRE